VAQKCENTFLIAHVFRMPKPICVVSVNIKISKIVYFFIFWPVPKIIHYSGHIKDENLKNILTFLCLCVGIHIMKKK